MNRFPVWLRLVLSIWLTIVVAWAGMLAWAAREEKTLAIEQAQDFALSIQQMTLAGLTGMMITETIDQRAVFLDQIKRTNHIQSIRVLRSAAVTDQYGTPPERHLDAAERAVLETGLARYEVIGSGSDERLRAILPSLAASNYLGKNCLGCHQVPTGTILGAVSMEISLKRVNASVDRFAGRVYWVAFLLSLPLGLFIYLYVNRLVIHPLARMTDGLNHIAEGDISDSRRLPEGRDDEIGRSVHAFNRVMDKAYELIDSQKLAKAVFENSLEGILISDRNNVIQMVNPAFTDTTGYTAEEAIGRTPAMFKSGEQSDDFYRAFWESLTTTGQWRGEIQNRRKNGEVYPEWINVSVVRNPSGEIEHYIALFSDITERKRNEEIIAYQAFHDSLTGLPNRKLFRDRLDQALAFARRQGQRTAVMFLDLDRFKLINDTLGHDVGDELLRKVAARLLASVRESDTVARQGGDEFTVLLPRVERPQDALAVGSKILNAMLSPFTLGGRELSVTTSIGISLFPDHGRDAETLMKHADTAMYFVKGDGRAGMHLFDDDLVDQPSRRLELQGQLHEALARGELTLYFQPLVDLSSGRIHATEALIRWQHPSLGLITPEDFVPLADETGLMVPIGTWVLQTACSQASAWLSAGRDIDMTVNLSAREFHAEDLVRTVRQALEGSGLPAERLIIEISETLAMQDVDYTIQKLMALSGLGVRVAIDDFGTAYSSLLHLKKMPIDYLKVDRRFVHTLLSDPDDRSVVRAVVGVAHNLSLEVIAEGVEQPEQLTLLREMGCNHAQGYLFGRPRPAKEIGDLLRREPTW